MENKILAILSRLKIISYHEEGFHRDQSHVGVGDAKLPFTPVRLQIVSQLDAIHQFQSFALDCVLDQYGHQRLHGLLDHFGEVRSQ